VSSQRNRTHAVTNSPIRQLNNSRTLWRYLHGLSFAVVLYESAIASSQASVSELLDPAFQSALSSSLRRDEKGTNSVKAVPLILILLAASPAVAQQPVTAFLPVPPSVAPFLGGVPTGTATNDVVTITVLDAIVRALQHNLGVLNAEEGLGRAKGLRWKTLSELLPNANARVSETRQKINLQAFGFGSPGGPSFPGVPNIVGPFNVFDARLSVSQSVVDLAALNDARADLHNVEAARLSSRSTRDFVINVAGTLYVHALGSFARAESARAQQQTAQALYDQALDLKNGGLIAGIDVLRAEVQLSTETQRSTAATNEFEKAKLQLARAIGLPLGQNFALDANLPELPTPDITLEQAVEQAFNSRPDYQAALERVRAAEATRRAAVGSGLPSVRVNADYGDIGLSPSDAQITYAVAGVVTIPIFQGGRLRGRLLEADADLRQRRAEAEDLKAAIYYEVRTAFLDLEATSQQLRTGTRARELAAQQLTQARDRFAAGVASNIEVVQAQEAVALANEQYISARYGYDLAKGGLLKGMGTGEATVRRLLGEGR
jgi:outer membrane protein TolC